MRGRLQAPFDAHAAVGESGAQERNVSYLHPPQWPGIRDLIPEEDVGECERQSESGEEDGTEAKKEMHEGIVMQTWYFRFAGQHRCNPTLTQTLSLRRERVF